MVISFRLFFSYSNLNDRESPRVFAQGSRAITKYCAAYLSLSTMSTPRVLISGASVAGPALAYWLVRAGCRVTIVERAPTLRTAGQGLDVRDTAREVIKRMGIFDLMKERSSHEEGIEIVDSNNHCFARFVVDNESGNGDSGTCDIEILRGELAGILFDITKNDVSYIFGDMVESMKHTEKEVDVRFTNGTPAATFDLVVAADGLRSKIRGMTFGNDQSHIRSLGSYISYFSIPRTAIDTMWARVHWVKGGRVVVMRPDNVGLTRAFLMLTAYEKSDERLSRLKEASKTGVQAQKELTFDLFKDADWETPRILDGMYQSDDFYLQHVAQVRLDRWSSGRVTMVGDAAYAPSPFSGMGTSLAFLGAYVLAGEISRQPGNIPDALNSYERILRPHVESIQKLAPGVPWIAQPQSILGIRLLESVIWGAGILSDSWLSRVLGKIPKFLPFSNKRFHLPDYVAFK